MDRNRVIGDQKRSLGQPLPRPQRWHALTYREGLQIESTVGISELDSIRQDRGRPRTGRKHGQMDCSILRDTGDGGLQYVASAYSSELLDPRLRPGDTEVYRVRGNEISLLPLATTSAAPSAVSVPSIGAVSVLASMSLSAKDCE